MMKSQHINSPFARKLRELSRRDAESVARVGNGQHFMNYREQVADAVSWMQQPGHNNGQSPYSVY